MTRSIRAILALAICAATTVPPAGQAGPRPGVVWFVGDFETGGLDGWIWDRPRTDSIQVVAQPVRKGHHAVRVTLAPGDVAASKERVELKIGDREIERVRGTQGREAWYGWSVLIPADYADPPGDQFQILAQWHQRPQPAGAGQRPQKMGAPPLTLHLVRSEGRHVLLLIGQTSSTGPPRTLGGRPIRLGAWIDLVFHVRWSTGRDGFVEAWLDGRPFTDGKKFEPTLYRPDSNYLRLGLYRGKGVSTTNHVYYDEVRLGNSYSAVAP
jgi:hypothetical protein